MPDTVEDNVLWFGKLDELIKHLAHVPEAARNQVDVAEPLRQEIEAAYAAHKLPAAFTPFWAQHRATISDALAKAVEQADAWDDELTLVATKLGR